MKRLLCTIMIIICITSLVSCTKPADSPLPSATIQKPSDSPLPSAPTKKPITWSDSLAPRPDYDFKHFSSFDELCAYFVPDEKTGEVRAILEKAKEPESCSAYIDKIVAERALWKPVFPAKYGEPRHLMLQNYGLFDFPSMEYRYTEELVLKFKYLEMSSDDIDILNSQGIRAFLAYKKPSAAETYLNIPDKRGEADGDVIRCMETVVLADGTEVEAVHVIKEERTLVYELYMFPYKGLLCWVCADGKEGVHLNDEFFAQFDIVKVEF